MMVMMMMFGGELKLQRDHHNHDVVQTRNCSTGVKRGMKVIDIDTFHSTQLVDPVSGTHRV